jgi:hypothetical protein
VNCQIELQDSASGAREQPAQPSTTGLYSKSIRDRFLEKVDCPARSGCWTWTGYVDARGYGRFRVGECVQPAHRISFELFREFIPLGECVVHRCSNFRCVNPKHLRRITRSESVRRGTSCVAANARKTRCASGHVFDEANTYRERRSGRRHCRACRRKTNNAGADFTVR